MTAQLIASIAGALAIAAITGAALCFVAKLVFWSLEERTQTEESDDLRKH